MSDIAKDYLIQNEVSQVLLGLVFAFDCKVNPSSAALQNEIEQEVLATKERNEDEIKRLVRQMLRNGKYKPTGRAKPASEYLQKAAREDTFPLVNNLVDINNLVSLEFCLPISILDLEKANTQSFLLRLGKKEEFYIFNSAGQQIRLEDLVLLATLPEDSACANPVKDSMRTKVSDNTKKVMAILYAPNTEKDRLAKASSRLGNLLEKYATTSSVHTKLV